VLSEKFSQDPIEEHFGRQRRGGGANENPTYYQFQKQERDRIKCDELKIDSRFEREH